MTSTVFYYKNNTTSTSTNATITQSSYLNTRVLIRVVTGTSCTTIGSLSSKAELTSVEISNTVTTLSNNCMQNTPKLNSIIYGNPSIITTGTSLFTNNTLPMTVKFFLTSSAPNAPNSQTGVYNTSLYPPGSTFLYYNGVSCYNEDTVILCLKNGEEVFVNINELNIGDFVKTYLHDFIQIKKIGKQLFKNNIHNNIECMYQINNLLITGGHFILLDEVPENKSESSIYDNNLQIDNKYCVLACDVKNAIKMMNNDIYTIYHLVLDGPNERYGIYVNNGILSESTTDENFIKHGFY